MKLKKLILHNCLDKAKSFHKLERFWMFLENKNLML